MGNSRLLGGGVMARYNNFRWKGCDSVTSQTLIRAHLHGREGLVKFGKVRGLHCQQIWVLKCNPANVEHVEATTYAHRNTKTAKE